MDIVIGRDTEQSRLLLTTGGKNTFYGRPGSVPKSVAGQHCLFSFTRKGVLLKNLDVNNYTYVNGRSIESKTVSKDDRIELGPDHYALRWEAVMSVAPADIRPLKDVWEEYENNNMKMEIEQRKFNTFRSTTGLITMIAIALSFILGGRGVWFMALYAFAIIVYLLFFLKAYRDSSSIPQKKQELLKKFQRDYVCPHCGHFLGNQSYEIVAQNTHCPYCKTQFIL